MKMGGATANWEEAYSHTQWRSLMATATQMHEQYWRNVNPPACVLTSSPWTARSKLKFPLAWVDVYSLAVIDTHVDTLEIVVVFLFVFVCAPFFVCCWPFSTISFVEHTSFHQVRLSLTWFAHQFFPISITGFFECRWQYYDTLFLTSFWPFGKAYRFLSLLITRCISTRVRQVQLQNKYGGYFKLLLLPLLLYFEGAVMISWEISVSFFVTPRGWSLFIVMAAPLVLIHVKKSPSPLTEPPVN